MDPQAQPRHPSATPSPGPSGHRSLPVLQPHQQPPQGAPLLFGQPGGPATSPAMGGLVQHRPVRSGGGPPASHHGQPPQFVYANRHSTTSVPSPAPGPLPAPTLLQSAGPQAAGAAGFEGQETRGKSPPAVLFRRSAPSWDSLSGAVRDLPLTHRPLSSSIPNGHQRASSADQRQTPVSSARGRLSHGSAVQTQPMSRPWMAPGAGPAPIQQAGAAGTPMAPTSPAPLATLVPPAPGAGVPVSVEVLRQQQQQLQQRQLKDAAEAPAVLYFQPRTRPAPLQQKDQEQQSQPLSPKAVGPLSPTSPRTHPQPSPPRSLSPSQPAPDSGSRRAGAPGAQAQFRVLSPTSRSPSAVVSPTTLLGTPKLTPAGSLHRPQLFASSGGLESKARELLEDKVVSPKLVSPPSTTSSSSKSKRNRSFVSVAEEMMIVVLKELRSMSTASLTARADLDRSILSKRLAEEKAGSQKDTMVQLQDLEQRLEGVLVQLQNTSTELERSKEDCSSAVAENRKLRAVLHHQAAKGSGSPSDGGSVEAAARAFRWPLPAEQAEEVGSAPRRSRGRMSSLLASLEGAMTSGERTQQANRLSAASEATTLKEGDAKRVLDTELDEAGVDAEERREVLEFLRQAEDRRREATCRLDEATSTAVLLENERDVLAEELAESRRALHFQKEVERQQKEHRIRDAARCQQLEAQVKELRHRAEVPEGNPEVRRLNTRLGEEQERLRELQAQLEQAEAFLEQAEAGSGVDTRRLEQELAQATHVCVEQRRALWDLESQLRRERDAGSACSPGEYLRLMRSHEHSSVSAENGRLKRDLFDAKNELVSVQKRLLVHEHDTSYRLMKGGA